VLSERAAQPQLSASIELNMRVLLVLSLLLTSCSSHAQKKAPEISTSPAGQQKAFEVIVPKATWEPIYFRAIDERARIANLQNLRAAALPDGDLETRIWTGFGLTALNGFIVKRITGEWAGTFVQGIHPRLAKKDFQIDLQTPKSGWDACWRRLVEAGVLSLPDARSIDCQGGALDGMSFVVETNMDKTYRTYMYDNPQFASCREARQMIEIVDILYEEFGRQLPRH
jgi:hypothetical protein